MALPQSLRTSVTPPELELIASEQLIDIVPLVTMEKTAFISVSTLRSNPPLLSEMGAYGPLRPPAKARVPLWIAANLKLKKKCHIVPPEWLSVEFLQEMFNRETSNPGFSPLPFRFAEISKVILDIASDDLENPDKIRTLLKDIREARQAKSRDGIAKLDHSELGLSGLCSMEINEIRPFFIKGMSVLTKLIRDPEHPPNLDEA